MPHGLAPFVGAVREASYSSDPEHCRAHPLVGFKQRLHTAPALNTTVPGTADKAKAYLVYDGRDEQIQAGAAPWVTFR